MNRDDSRLGFASSPVFPAGFWKYSGIVMAALVVLVLIGGMFYAGAKVPYPKDTRLEFPAAEYATASERFPQPADCPLLDKAFFTRRAIALLEQELPFDPLRQLISDTTTEFRDKLVIVRRGSSAGGNFEVICEQKRTDLEQEEARLENKIRGSSYMSSYADRAALENVRRQLGGLENLRRFLSEFSLKASLGMLSYTDSYPEIRLLCGYLTEISRNMTVELREAAPVIDLSFLTMAGISQESVEDIDFSAERGAWEEAVTKAKGKHGQAAAALREKIDRDVRRRREAVRIEFYTRWIGFLAMAFSTLCTFLALKRYSLIIRRKGLPQKSTFAVYFATNVTSLVLRWVALVIVIIGMIELWAILILQLFQSTIQLPFFPLINKVANVALSPVSGLMGILAAGRFATVLLYSILAPVAFGLLIVVQSWLVLLFSEYVCFVSNAYHVLFNLAHPGESAPGRAARQE